MVGRTDAARAKPRSAANGRCPAASPSNTCTRAAARGGRSRSRSRGASVSAARPRHVERAARGGAGGVGHHALLVAGREGPQMSRRTVPKTPAKGRARRPTPAATSPPVAARLLAALRRIPVTAWVCALIACLNAVCWSVISPPFQVPDEPSHYAYVAAPGRNGSPALLGGAKTSRRPSTRLPERPAHRSGAPTPNRTRSPRRPSSASWNSDLCRCPQAHRQRRRGRRRLAAAAVLRAGDDPLRPGVGRHGARPAAPDAPALRADGAA